MVRLEEDQLPTRYDEEAQLQTATSHPVGQIQPSITSPARGSFAHRGGEIATPTMEALPTVQ